MKWFRRAWLSVIRQPKKTITLFLVAFVMGNLLAGSLGIIMTCEQIRNYLKEDLGKTASIVGDFAEDYYLFINYNEKKTGINDYVSIVNQLLEDERVVSGEYHIFLSGFSKNDVKNKWFNFYGTNLSVSSEFLDGTHKLTSSESRFFTDEELEDGKYVAIVDSELGYEYIQTPAGAVPISTGLCEVGNVVALSVEVRYTDENGSVSSDYYDYDFEVIGAFTSNGDSSVQSAIYIPNNALLDILSKTIEQTNQKGYDVELYFRPDYASYALDENVNLDEFDSYAKELLLPISEDFEYTSSNTTYKKNAGPMENLNTIANVIFIASVFATIIVLGLVVISLIVERKKEMGIYKSIGEKKNNIMMQIICEVVLVATIATSLSSISGLFLGNKLSDYMLEVQRYVQRDQNLSAFSGIPVIYNPIEDGFVFNTRDDLINNYEIKPSVEYFVVMFFVGELTVIISCSLPLVYLLSLKPKEIMI